MLYEECALVTLCTPTLFQCWSGIMNYFVCCCRSAGPRESFEAVMVILAFSVVPASFVLFVIEERIHHSKHLQFRLHRSNYFILYSVSKISMQVEI